jgi:type 1 glutamine amidotransferase
MNGTTRRQFTAAAIGSAALRGQLSRQSVLIVDGRNNHDWHSTSPVLKRLLEQTGLFRVEFATAGADPAAMEGFLPAFCSFNVIVLNYSDFGNGGDWSKSAKASFVKAVENGAGIVVYHAASSAFPNWKEFNRIAGLGGWAGRDERSGPLVYWRDGAFVRDASPAKAGHHGPRHPYPITARQPAHPILAGLPTVWMHASDELYDMLRGPAEEMEVLATAWSDPTFGGTGRDEPALFTVRFGRGRIFHTILGHDPAAMECVGFITTLQRGAEWAATGRVTQSPPAGFPTETQVRLRA